MEKEIRVFYSKYKPIILPSVLIFLSIFTIFKVILPQLDSISGSNQLIDAGNLRVSSLQNDLAKVTALSDSQVDENLSIATQSLPTSKDIALIFTALSDSASDAGVNLKDFSLKVGGVFGRAAKVDKDLKAAPALTVSVRIQSDDAKETAAFAQALQKRIPLAEVKTITALSNGADFSVNFFYKPVDIAGVSNTDNLKLPTQADLNLLNQLKEGK